LTKRFGYWAEKDEFAKGLQWLLENDRWRRLGEEGYSYVKENHNLDRVISSLIAQVQNLIR
jgi:glycosyltransferase involved in cell wall biosynthesis